MKTSLVPGGETYADLVTTTELADFARATDPQADSTLRDIANGVFHHLERDLGRALILQDVILPVAIPDWAYLYGKSHWEEIKLPLPPLQSVTSITWKEWSGTEYVIPVDRYTVDLNSEPGVVRFKGNSRIYPSALLEPEGKGHLLFRFQSGYMPGRMPEGLRLVAKRIIATHYENPENTIAGIDESVLLLPADLSSTYELYRIVDFDVEYGE